MVDLNKLLHPDDIEILEGQPSVNWIPKDPREVILPYVEEKVTSDDRKTSEYRKEQAKKVVEGYSNVINKCKEIEAVIEQRCKNVTVKLNTSEHLNVIDAIGRLFGIETTEITFEMYKICVQKMAEMSNDRVPKLGDKNL